MFRPRQKSFLCRSLVVTVVAEPPLPPIQHAFQTIITTDVVKDAKSVSSSHYNSFGMVSENSIGILNVAAVVGMTS